jgi:hypothetical protein
MHTRNLFAPLLFVVLTTIGSASADGSDELKSRAEKWFTAVYTGDASIVDKLASDKIVISYPIFEKLFNKPAIRGREDVKAFVVRFGRRWTEQKVTFDEALVDGNKVVLIWSFQARAAGIDQGDQSPSEPQHWGGITFVRFDDDGKIAQEIGEESDPGPFGRLRASVKGSDGDDR